MTIHVYCYKVRIPGETVWFYEDYPGAFEHTTGQNWRDAFEKDLDDDYLEDVNLLSQAELTCFGWSR